MSYGSNTRVGTVFVAEGGQFRSELDMMMSKLTQMRGGIGQTNQQLGQMGKLGRAVGTTLRYAFAGALVYGVATAINSLGEFEAKLGEIESLATRFGTHGPLEMMGSQVDQLGDRALIMSNKYGLAVNDILLANQAALSSFDRGSRSFPVFAKQVDQYTEAFARLQLISEQSDPQAMSRALTGLVTATPGHTGHEGKFASDYVSMIAAILQQSPNIRGEDIARDIGRLGAAGFASGMRPSQFLGLYLSASQAGGSASVLGRGITQLIGTSILNPKSKDQKAAFQQMGLPTDPTALRELGGGEILRRMFKAVAPGGTRATKAQLARLNDPDLAPDEAAAAAGLRGVNLTLLYKAIGRQESVRQFLALLTQGPDAIKKFTDSLTEAAQINLGKQRADVVNSRRYMQQLQKSLSNLNLEMIRGLGPGLKVLSGGARHVSDFAVDHPNISRGLLFGTIGAAGLARILSMTSLGGRLPGPLGRLLGRAGGGTMQRNLAASTVLGAGLGAFDSQGKGTKNDPMWVVIDPLSWVIGTPSGGGLGPNAPGGTKVPPILPLGRMGRLARFGVPAAVALGGYEMVQHKEAIDKVVSGFLQKHGLGFLTNQNELPTSLASAHALAKAAQQGGLAGRGARDLQRQALHMNLDKVRNPAERAWWAVVKAEAGGGATPKVDGKAEVEVMLLPGQDFLRWIKSQKVHTTMKLDSSGKRPQHRGQNKTTRTTRAGGN